MKREAINLIAVIGLVLLGAAVVLGLLVGVLFIFPNSSILGARAVNERDTQIVYQDEELTNAFANGKFILESYGTQVEVKMSNAGYEGQNTVVVNESATGIAFNNLNRTLIEWTQTLYDNELYYRIKILEPSGMVFNQNPTTVYINLPYRDDSFRYNFVLQNHYSAVNFSFVDDTIPTDALLVHNLVIESASNVNFPYHQNNSIDNVTIKGDRTKLTCQSPVLHDVVVSGANNILEFGNSNLAGINGDLTISGNNNQFRGTTASHVNFTADDGSLNMNGAIAALDVKTVRATFNVKTVTGGVSMETQSGDLQVNSVGNGLNFTAGTASAPSATASVNANKVTGAVIVNNYGVGTVTLHDVDGNVKINSYQINGGKIDVSFLREADAHDVDIMSYDGDINVREINGGKVKIAVLGELARAGAANIYAQFNHVGTDCEITTGGYLSGPVEWGNVDVKLADNCNDVNLYIYYARSANSSHKYGYDEINMNIIDAVNSEETPNHIVCGGEGTTGVLKIRSQNKVYLS